MATLSESVVNLVVQIATEIKGSKDLGKDLVQPVDKAFSDIEASVKKALNSMDPFITKLQEVEKEVRGVLLGIKDSVPFLKAADPTKVLGDPTKVLNSALATLRTGLTQIAQEYKAGFLTRIIDDLNQLPKVSTQAAKTLDSLKANLTVASKAPSGDLLQWLRSIENAILLAKKASTSKSIRGTELANQLGADLTEALKKQINIKAVFDEAFKGNATVLEPLKKILGETAFLNEFSKYVKNTFKDVSTDISTASDAAAKQLGVLGERAITTTEGLNNLKGGFIGNTDVIRNLINQYSGFTSVQTVLDGLFKTNTKQVQDNTDKFRALTTTVVQSGNALQQVRAVLETATPAQGGVGENQLVIFKEFVATAQTATDKLKELQAAETKLNKLEALGLASGDEYKKTTADVAKLTTELQLYQTQLRSFDATNFTDVSIALTHQNTELTKLKTGLEQLSVPPEINSVVTKLVQGFSSAQQQVTDLETRFTGFGNSASETANKIETVLSRVSGKFGQKLITELSRVEGEIQNKFKDLRIPPLELTSLKITEPSGTYAMFPKLAGMITGLNEQWGTFVAHLQEQKVDPSAIRLIEGAIKKLAPAMSTVLADSTKFGSLFNSLGNEPRSNLELLEVLLTNLAKTALGVETAFAAPIRAISGLRQELNTTADAQDRLAVIKTSARSLEVEFRTLVPEVTKLAGTFDSLYQAAGRRVATDSTFEAMDKSVGNLINKVTSLQKEIDSIINAGKSSSGQSTFTAQLEAQITTTRSLLQRLRTELTSTLQAPLENVKTNYIDENLSTTSKEFVKFKAQSEKALNDVSSAFLKLDSQSVAVFNKVRQNFSQMMAALADPSALGIVATNLSSLVRKLKTEIETNTSVISIDGVKTAAVELKDFINILREYAVAQQAAARIKLGEELNKSNPNATQVQELRDQVRSYTILSGVLRRVETNVDKTTKKFLDNRVVLEAQADATKNVITKFTALEGVFNNLTKSSGAFDIGKTVTAFNNMEVGSQVAATALDKIIKKLEDLVLAGHKIPADLLPPITVGSTTVTFDTLEQLVAHLKTVRQEIAAKPTNASGIVEPLQIIKTALEGVLGTYNKTHQALGYPLVNLSNIAVGADAIRFLESNLATLDSQFKLLGASAKDFGTLQLGYSQQKEGLSNLLQVIQQVISALQSLPKGSEVTFNGNKIGVDSFIQSLTTLGETVTKQMVPIREGLQAGGQSLDNFLLTGATGSRWEVLRDRITAFTTAVVDAEGRLQNLGKNGASVQLADVEALKTTIAELIKERTAITNDIRNAVDRMNTGLKTTEAALGAGNFDPLQTQIKGAIAEFDKLSARINGVQTSIGGVSLSVKDFGKGAEGILQFSEATARLQEALSSVKAPVGQLTQFDASIRTLSEGLAQAERQLGITNTAFDHLDKPVLQSYLSDLQTKVSELTGAFVKVTREITLMELAKKSNAGTPTVDDSSLQKATADAAALRKEIETLQHRMGVLKEIMRKQPEGTNALAQSELDVATSVEKVKGAGALLSKFMSKVFDTIIKGNPAFNQLGGNAEEAANRIKLLASAVREMEEKLVTSLRNMDMMAMGLQMLGQAMVEPFKKSLDAYSKFSDTMAFIQGATSATEKDMESLAQAAVIMGSTTRQSAQDAADGLKQLALAGYNAKDSIQVLPTVLRLAQAAEMQLGPATEILVNIMASQRIGIEGIADATDVLALAANRTTATFTDMGTAFKYIGALAGTIGNSFEDTAGAVALLHNSGLRGSMAGTALRGSLQALLNPTKDEARVMGELSKRLGGVGLQIQDAQGKFVGFRKIIEQFEQAGITTSEVLELFGQRAGPGMAALLQTGSAKLGDLIDDLGNAEGATGRLSKNMEETFAGSVKMMGNSLEALGEVIGHAIAGPLSSLAHALTTVTQKLVQFGTEYPLITSVLSNVAGVVAVSLLAFGSLALTWTMMLVPAKQLMSFIRTLFTTLVFGASALRGATDASLLFMATQLKNGKSMSVAVGATNKFTGALLVLKTTMVLIGQTMFSVAGAFSPLGLALWGIAAVIGIVIFAFTTMKKNLGVVNAEFDKNRQVIVSNVAEFRNLKDQIISTANSILALRSKNASLDGTEFINLKGFQQQKAKLLAQIQELRTRIKESKLGEAYNVADQFDVVTGDAKGMVITLAKTGEAFASLNVDMLSTTEGTLAIIDNMKKINEALSSVGRAEIEKSLNEQLQANLENSSIEKTKGWFGSYITDTQTKLDKLLSLQKQYNRFKEELAQAEINGDKEKYEKLRIERSKFFSVLEMELGTEFGAQSFEQSYKTALLPAIQQQLDKLAQQKRDLTTIIENHIRRVQETGGVVNKGVVRTAVLKALADSGNYSDVTIKHIGPQIDAIFVALQKRAEVKAESTDFGTATEKMFRGLQRQVSSGVKQLDELIKQLTSRQEEIKRLLDIYEKNADTFAKVRDEFVSAGKAELDVGIRNVEQTLNDSLSKIVGTAYKNYGDVAKASISWTDPASAATREEADQFQVIQDTKVAMAKSAADKMYNIFTNSAQKQIDDLERSSKVTEQVFRIPIRLESEEVFNSFTGEIRRFVVGGEKATRELFEYEVMFNQKLLEERVNLETSSLNAKQAAINEEMAMTQSFYAKVRPLYGENTVKRIELEQEAANKQRDLQQKGVENAKAALNTLYAEHKKISDKIVTLKQNEAKMIERLDALRNKVRDTGLNEIQKREQSFQKIANLMKVAETAEGEGNFDKALKAYEKMATLAEGIQFEPFDTNTKADIIKVSDQIEEGYQRVTAANERAATGQLTTLETVGKSIQDGLKGFEAGVKTFSDNLATLAEKMEQLKADFAKEMNIDLQTVGAANKLVALEQQVLELRRIMETPMELVLNDDAFKKLKEYRDESVDLSKKKFEVQNDREGLEKIQQRISATNDLIAVTKNLAQAITVYERRLETSEKVKVGAKVEDMDSKDVEAINKALKDREDALTSLQRAYEAAKQTFPETMQAELDAVIKSRTAFEEGKNAAVVYTQEIADSVKVNGDLIKKFTTEHAHAQQKSTLSLVETLQTQIPAMLELSKKMSDLASDKNLNIQVRVSASTNLSQLYKGMLDLNKELDKTQTSDAFTMLRSQMEGYKKSLLESGNVNDAVTQERIKSIDEDIKAIDKLQQATEISNREKIKQADQYAQKMTEMQKTQQAEQTAKIAASPEDAAKAGAENAKIVAEEAQKNPAVVPVVVNQDQAKAAGQVAAQAVQQGVTTQSPVATVATKVDKGQVQQEVAETVKTVSASTPPVPIKVDSNELHVTASAVEKLKEKLMSMVQANTTSPLRFFGDKSELSRQAEAVRKELDSLLLRKDEFGKIKLDVNDTSLKSASSLLSEMESKADNYSAKMIAGANEVAVKLQVAKNEAELNPTVGNLAEVQKYEGQLERIRIALMTIKKVEETPSQLDVVPAGLTEKVTTLGNSFTTLKQQIDAASADHPELSKYGTVLEGLQTKLASLNEQVEQGFGVDPAKFEEIKTRFLKLLEDLKTNGPKIGVSIADTDTVKTELNDISALLTTVPEFKVTSDHTQIDQALEVTNKLLGLDGKRTNIEVVANLVTNRQGGSTGFKTGGLVELIAHFATGGLAQIQHFASGGRTMFKRIANMVPGVGSGDKVPAMLEPGEYVIRKSMVERYGTGFMEGINKGLIQFRALGGRVFDMPTQALSGMQQYVIPNYPIPETATGGPSVDVRLHLGGKVFNMKSPRDQVKDLVNAVKQIDRGY